MTSSARLCAAGLIAMALAVASPSGSRIPLPMTPPHTLTDYVTLLERASVTQIVGLVRVLSVDSLAHIDTTMAPMDSMSPMRRRTSRLEVVEWLRGGLDGEIIEVTTREGGYDPPAPASWHDLAGIDTMGAVVLLRRHKHGWELARLSFASIPEGFRPVPQREFKAYSDSARRGREATRP